jgi:hypothetical protein
MKIVNKSTALLLSFLAIGSFTYAQDAGPEFFDTIEVSATVVEGTSSISVESPAAINFSGQTLVATVDNTRYLSDEVTLSYFAANGPWEIRVYTTNTDDLTGLVNADASSTVTLKVTTADRDGNFGDVTDEDQWGGADDVLRFLRVLDDGTRDDLDNPFFAIIASSANENPSSSSDLKVKFGIDIAGAKAEEHKAVVTFEMAIL